MTCNCQVITAYGLTGPIMPPSPSSTSSQWPEEAQSKEQSGGGLEVTGLIIGNHFKQRTVRKTSLTKFSYTDTDLDPYNAERGFWWVSDHARISFSEPCP